MNNVRKSLSGSAQTYPILPDSTSCNGLVIHCGDYRFQTAIHAFAGKKYKTFDRFCMPGAAKCISEHRETPDDLDFAFRSLALYISKHPGIQTMAIIHHEGCGAYGQHHCFKPCAGNRKKELDFHQQELTAIKLMIAKEFPSFTRTPRRIETWFLDKSGLFHSLQSPLQMRSRLMEYAQDRQPHGELAKQ